MLEAPFSISRRLYLQQQSTCWYQVTMKGHYAEKRGAQGNLPVATSVHGDMVNHVPFLLGHLRAMGIHDEMSALISTEEIFRWGQEPKQGPQWLREIPSNKHRGITWSYHCHWPWENARNWLMCGNFDFFWQAIKAFWTLSDEMGLMSRWEIVLSCASSQNDDNEDYEPHTPCSWELLRILSIARPQRLQAEHQSEMPSSSHSGNREVRVLISGRVQMIILRWMLELPRS